MTRLAEQFKTKNLTVAALLFILAAGGFLWRSHQINAGQPSPARPPDKTGFVFDYARLLSDAEVDLNRTCKSLEETYAIETIVVTTEGIPDEFSMAELARRLIENWQIGGSLNGRGILILAASGTRQVYLSVASGLVDSFSDGFRRHIRNWPWEKYFNNDEVSSGISSALAQIEARARQIEESGGTFADIQRYDRQLLSGSPVPAVENVPERQMPDEQ